MTSFEIPQEIEDYLAVLDDFIEREIKPIEQRDQKILAREALGDLLLEEEQSGRPEIIQAIQQLSVRMGEEATEQFLMDCAAKAASISPSSIR